MRRLGASCAFVLALASCRGDRDKARPAPTAPARDAVAADAAAKDANAWSALDGYPRVEPVRTIALPARPGVPRFDVGGPVLAGDIAVVASSQFGFIGVDWRRGEIAWTKPAGHHVAPPVIAGDRIVLVGECHTPPLLPRDEVLVGCLRVVAASGADRAAIAIRAKAGTVDEFLAAPGAHALWVESEERVRWRRGDAAVSVDLLTGKATPAPARAPALAVTDTGRTWQVEHVDGRVVAGGHSTWQTEHAYTALVGVTHVGDAPLLRLAHIRPIASAPHVHLIDMDPTGSLHTSTARPVPGIALHAAAISPIGDTALAVRMDASIQRDFIAGYASNALLMWVWALPEVPRADPVGVAIAQDAVVVFHDGDTLTVLPELSAPPTSPGAPSRASRNPTP